MSAAVEAQLQTLRTRELAEGRESVERERRAFLSSVKDADGLLIAAQILTLQHRFDLAPELAERAVKMQPSSQRQFTLAQIYYLARRPADAVAALQSLLSEHAGDFSLLAELGVAFVAMGETDRAREALDAAIAAEPRWAPALHERALLDKVRAGDAIVAKLEAANAAALQPAHQVQLHYARGKAFDDLGEHARAFAAYAEGAALNRRIVAFNEQNELRAHEAAQSLPAPSRVETGKRFIFVIGMPRTGTTLTEQILLGDPAVTSIGETPAFAESARLGANLGANYLQRLSDYGAQNSRIVLDKTPTNYVWAPMAAEALDARIVHCTRDVLDTCWSLYTTWFGMGTAWSYDFAEIARAYGRYANLMQVWRDRVPMIDVSYEALTAEPEAASQQLFAHCGLNWSADALAFASRRRTVITPSMAQVRKPVSRASVRRVEPYLPMLAPLLEALAKEGLA